MIIASLFHPLTSTIGLSASPISITELTTAASGTTATCTVTASGGTTPYTYAWTIDEPAITITSPTAAATTFGYSDLYAMFDTVFGLATCTVTDRYGSTGVINISVYATRVS